MADKYATPVFEEGVYTPPVKGNLTGRQDPILGTIRDTVLETAAGAIDVLATPYAYGRDVAVATGDQKLELAAQMGQRGASRTKEQLRGWKTDFGRQEDLNGGENATWLSRAAEALPPAIPAIATAMLTGPAAPATYGALAHGQQSQQFEEMLYNMPREQLEKLEGYKKHKAEGLGHDEIMRAMHTEMRNDWKAWLPNVGANVFFGGVASHLVGKIGSRSIAQTMTDRIMRNALPDLGEAIGGGYLTGVGQSAGRQAGEITAGTRQDYSLGEMHHAGTDIASVVAPLGVASAASRLRGPRAPAAATTTGSLIDDANKRPTPAIGTELNAVATENLKSNNIGTAETPPAPKPGEAAPVPPTTGVDPTVPTASAAGVTPPGSEVQSRPAGATSWVDVDPTRPSETPSAAAQQAHIDITAPPGEAITPVDPAVAAGVTTPEGSLGRDIKGVQEELQNLTQQRRSLDAASPDQKATLEWREESARIDQELERVTQAAAAPPSPVGAAAPSAAAGPTQPTPTAVAGVEPVVAAAPKMTLDELKARVADHAQTPTIDALNAAINEYKTQHGLKKLPEHSAVTKAWSEGKTQARKAVGEQRQAEQQAAREAKRTRQAEEKLQREQAKADKKTTAEQAGLAKKQAKGYAKLAREQAQKVTQAGKAPLEPTKDATPAKAPRAEEAAAPAEAKPAGETTPPEAEAKADPDLIRRKLGLKPLGAQEVTHGKEAAPAIAKLASEREAAGRKAWDPVTKRETKEAQKQARAEAKAASREDQVTQRETTAKQTLEDHKPGANYIPELESIEGALKEGKADSPKVKSHIAQVIADVKEMVADYGERIHNLAGGKDHPVFRYASGKGFEVTKEGKEKAASRARSGKGEYHNFLGEMGNFLDKVEAALKKGDDARAKDLTLRYLENSRLVREGDIKEVTASRQKASDEVGSKKKTDQAPEGEGIDRLVNKQKGSDAQEKLESDVEANLARKPVRQLTDDELRARGMAVPKRNAKGEVIGWLRQEIPGQPHSDYVGGVRHVADDYRVGTFKKALAGFERDHGRKPTMEEILRIGEQLGHDVRRSSLGELMEPHRPTNPIMGAVFDAVHAMVKDMPAHVMSVDMAEALISNARAAYNPHYGAAIFRPDTLVERTVFHEALHAATARALYGSERLQHLVTRLQDIIERTYKHSPVGQAMPAYEYAITRNGKRVTTHEFLSELFTRQGVRDMVEQVKLRERDIRDLRAEGYNIGRGETLLGSLWRNFLEAIGYKPDRPNAMKIAVDMLQDVFDREHELRARDLALGYSDIGRIYSTAEIRSLAHDDPVHGTAAHDAMLAGNKLEAMTALMEMNERGTLSEKSADMAIDYLKDVNRGYWGDDVLPEAVTPLSTPETVRSDVSKFLDDRFGSTAKDWAWQFDNKFGTPIRNFLSGLTYTNDIGATLETAFQNVLKPLKDAWSRREHFAQKYMDESGANKLIDKIATTKNAIKDRQLWADWEQLMIRESYSRSRADEEIGVGANAHLRSGDLRDRQSIQDHAKNRVILEAIKARNPELIALRNEVFDFTKKEQVQRHKASIRDMLRQMKQVDHNDELAISALTKDVMRDNKSITAAERTALDRALKLGKESDAYRNWEIERDRLRTSVGEADPSYKKHAAKEAKLLTELTSKQYETYKKNREDIRRLVDPGYHQGPHVPFMRHGNHAVYSEFDITPDKGVKYNEVEPTADLHKQFDFASRADAENFIDNTLSHEAVNVTVNNAYEVVYDTRTGERAAEWRVEKPDRTATTYESREAAEAAMEKGDTIAKRDMKAEDVEALKSDGKDTSHLEVRHRVVFNPREFVKFESEREAHEYRDRLAGDSGHANMTTRTSNVESEHQMVGRANVAYTSAEMRQWINRQEASPEYQRMDPSEKEDWARKLRVEAARVTATAGRRSAMMPRDYTRGASTDLLKGMIDYGGSNARAIADLTYRADIDKGLTDAEAYVAKYRDQSGFDARRLEGETEAAFKARRAEGQIGYGHRARDDAMIEIKKRLFEPPKVEGSWAQGVRRALQVSMISHLADTAYLIVNAIEPWVFGASVTAARHGWAGAYREQIEATRLVDPTVLAKQVWSDLGEAWRSEFGGANPYEDLLLKQVNSPGNPRGDGVGLDLMMKHMFNKGLAARDVGMEVERIHDPSSNIIGRGLDWMDGLFRAANTGIETQNRATMAIANYRLEYNRALRDMGLPEPKSETYKVDGITHTRSTYTFDQKAHDQAIRYAEDSIFKGAGDYSQWNNPRYFNNPMLRLATQFKKYPLRIASVYADAMMGALKGDGEKQKQLAYMLIAQSVAAGGMGLPIMSPVAGLTNALYLLGITDGNYEDMELWIRKQMASRIGVTATDLAMHGAFRFTGADFSQKMSQSSFIFRGSPASRKPEDVVMSLMKVAGGAPANVISKGLGGIQKLGEAAGDVSAGAHTQGVVKGMEAVSGIMQIKALEDLMKAGGMMMGGVKGAPSTQPVTAGQVAATAVGFTPTSLANRRAAKAAVNLEKKRDQEWRTRWVNRYRDARTPGEETAIWAEVQKANQNVAPELRIKFEDLWKAKQRKKREEARDDTKLGVKLSGRQKSFADTSKYFSVQ